MGARIWSVRTPKSSCQGLPSSLKIGSLAILVAFPRFAARLDRRTRSFPTLTNKLPILIGTVLFACLALVMVPRHVRSIESDISQRTESALALHGLAARVEVHGRDVILLGAVSSPEVRLQATSVVGDLWGVRSVENRLSEADGDRLASLSPPSGAARSERPSGATAPRSRAAASPPTVRVYVELSADRNLKLAGQAPSAAAKESWLAEALAVHNEGAVQDRLEIVDSEDVGNAGDMEAAVLEGLALLPQLEEGRLSATGSRLRISGVASDEGLEATIKQRLIDVLPRGYRVSVDIYVPRMPEQSAAELSTRVMRLLLARGRDDAIIVSGVAPSAAVKESLLAAAIEQYSAERVRDRLQVREVEAPPHYGDCVVRALPWLDKLINGRIEISPGKARVYGKVGSAEEANRLQSELAEAGCATDVARLAVRTKGS